MKDIVIIANYCRDFSETDNGRFMYLCKELSKENKVEIITSDFIHGKKKHKDPLIYNWPFKITFLHEPGYKKNVSIGRFISHRAWGKEVGKYLEKRKKPDVIYSAVPSLTGPYIAGKYCERNNIRFIIDIQDLWPEAFKLVFNVPVISDILFAPFNFLANGIYKRADVVCGVSKTYVNKALKVNRKCETGHVVFLGTKLATFDENVRKNSVYKPENEIWLGYCGTLGASYDLTVVFDALHQLRNDGKVLPKFIVMGDGERRKEFKDRGVGLDCVFTGRLPYDQMCGWLSACDIAVNPITHGAAQSIINKHGDYAASGLPVINTQECQEYRELVEEYKMGFSCQNSKDVGQRIEQLMEDKKLRIAMSHGARRCAEEKFDRARTYLNLVKVILS